MRNLVATSDSYAQLSYRDSLLHWAGEAIKAPEDTTCLNTPIPPITLRLDTRLRHSLPEHPNNLNHAEKMFTDTASGGVVVDHSTVNRGDPGSIPSRTGDMSGHAPRRCALGKITLHDFPHSTQSVKMVARVDLLRLHLRLSISTLGSGPPVFYPGPATKGQTVAGRGRRLAGRTGCPVCKTPGGTVAKDTGAMSVYPSRQPGPGAHGAPGWLPATSPGRGQHVYSSETLISETLISHEERVCLYIVSFRPFLHLLLEETGILNTSRPKPTSSHC
ncbi:hypothetical protein Bbelb_399250 [Branchiostoma belcheri]|nr:hypothetical protein Bbelb_399250 [Branchiostoma belcheri]